MATPPRLRASAQVPSAAAFGAPRLPDHEQSIYGLDWDIGYDSSIVVPDFETFMQHSSRSARYNYGGPLATATGSLSSHPSAYAGWVLNPNGFAASFSPAVYEYDDYETESEYDERTHELDFDESDSSSDLDSDGKKLLFSHGHFLISNFKFQISNFTLSNEMCTNNATEESMSDDSQVDDKSSLKRSHDEYESDDDTSSVKPSSKVAKARLDNDDDDDNASVDWDDADALARVAMEGRLFENEDGEGFTIAHRTTQTATNSAVGASTRATGEAASEISTVTSSDASSDVASSSNPDAILTLRPAFKKPVFSKLKASPLTSLLPDFLSRMAAANAELEQSVAAGEDMGIEVNSDEEGEHIEMNLGLGVLEEKTGDDSTSDSDSDSDEENDVMQKLKGEFKDPKDKGKEVGIQEL
jgi:hypothetical protein